MRIHRLGFIFLVLAELSSGAAYADDLESCSGSLERISGWNNRLGELAKQFWQDESGVVISTEAVMAAGLLTFGVATGLATLRDAVVEELQETARAVGSIDQSFVIPGIKSPGGSSVAGSSYQDSDQTQNPGK